MLEQIEGSLAIAKAIALCRPEVICAYPITPQTHIVEGLGAMVKSGALEHCEFINVESEFAALSVAIGHGKKAARNIDAWLGGGAYVAPEKHPVAKFDDLNPWYYADAPQMVQPTLDLLRRQSSFDEVVGGLDESNALFEARRCLSCGNCFECDNCYGVCPDNAVVKLGPGQRFAINYDYCKGCGLCAAECPCGAIEMVPEKI